MLNKYKSDFTHRRDEHVGFVITIVAIACVFARATWLMVCTDVGARSRHWQPHLICMYLFVFFVFFSTVCLFACKTEKPASPFVQTCCEQTNFCVVHVLVRVHGMIVTCNFLFLCTFRRLLIFYRYFPKKCKFQLECSLFRWALISWIRKKNALMTFNSPADELIVRHSFRRKRRRHISHHQNGSLFSRSRSIWIDIYYIPSKLQFALHKMLRFHIKKFQPYSNYNNNKDNSPISNWFASHNSPFTIWY